MGETDYIVLLRLVMVLSCTVRHGGVVYWCWHRECVHRFPSKLVALKLNL